MIKMRFSSKRVLIVIDDVDNVDQLKMLAGELNWFGVGSRIIITTRDEHLLAVHGVEIVHRVGGLSFDNALTLFNWNAFRKPRPEADYVKLSHCVIEYAQGLPLALVVLGLLLYGKSAAQWKIQLEKLKRIPNKDINATLKLSYDSSEENEKAVFLDIACFFRGRDRDEITEFLNAFVFDVSNAVEVLIERSLISIENNKLQMHDLIQSMGRHVVDQQSPNSPSGRSRLWFHGDVLPLLTENAGTNKIEGIALDLPQVQEFHLSAEAFTRMPNLRTLIIRNAHILGDLRNLPNELRWLEWPEFPFDSMPFGFHATKLVVLDLNQSRIKQLHNVFTRWLGMGFKNCKNLTYMNLMHCKCLTETPDVTAIPNLQKLDLSYCSSLERIHKSIGFLKKLVFLNLGWCCKLRSLPGFIVLRSLETLHLDHCSKLEKFPVIVGEMPGLRKVDLTETVIKELPACICSFTNLRQLTLNDCKQLQEIPELPTSVKNLEARNCKSLEKCSTLSRLFEILNEVQSSAQEHEMLEVQGFESLDIYSAIEEAFEAVKEHLSVFEEEGFESSKFYSAIEATFETVKKLRSDYTSNENLERDSLLKKILPILEEVFRFDLKRSKRLYEFDFSNCHKLAEDFEKNLKSMLLESTSLTKAHCEDIEIQVILPASNITEWFGCYSAHGCISLEVPPQMQGKISALVFCAIIRSWDECLRTYLRSFKNTSNDQPATTFFQKLCRALGATWFCICMLLRSMLNIWQVNIELNGQKVTSVHKLFRYLQSDRMWLFYLPCCLIPEFNSLSSTGQNPLVVSVIIKPIFPIPEVKMCGAYFK